MDLTSCNSKGGTASGHCASGVNTKNRTKKHPDPTWSFFRHLILGFGVCCLFIVQGACSTEQIISQVNFHLSVPLNMNSTTFSPNTNAFSILELHIYSGETKNASFHCAKFGFVIAISCDFASFQNAGYPAADTAVSQTCTYNFNRISNSRSIFIAFSWYTLVSIF